MWLPNSTTIYVHPPEKKPSGKQRAPKGPVDEISKASYKHRTHFIPILLSFFLGAWTAIAEIFGYRWIIPSVIVAFGIFLWFAGIEKPLSKPDTRWKKIERGYGLAVCALGIAWASLIDFTSGWKIAFGWYVALLLGTYPIATPWIWHRRIRGSIAITFAPGIPFRVRRQMESRGRTVIMEWDIFTRASSAAGSNLIKVDFDHVSVTLHVRLGHARVAEDFTDLRLRRLESAFEARRGSARVLPVQDKSARLVDITFMLADPLKESIIPSDADATDPDEMTLDIGVFETGQKVIIDIIHTLIAGASDAGKSGIVNAIMRGLARKKKIAVVGIDMKPGAPELGKWERLMYGLATDAVEAEILLTKIMYGIERRGAIMKERGIRKWIPTEEEPFIVLVIDEAAQIKKAGPKLTQLLVKISELSRAYGFAMIMATQHPTDKSIPTEAVANCLQRIGLACKANTAERLIFGDDATKDGWRLSPRYIKVQGMFRIQSRRYGVPNLARAYWMDDDAVDFEVARFTPERTAIDDGTWNAPVRGGHVPRAIEPEDLEPGDDDVQTAVIVENGPEDLVYMAVIAGIGVPDQISTETGVPKRTVNEILKRLQSRGQVRLTNPGGRASVRNPWIRT